MLQSNYDGTRSLGACWAKTSSLRPFGPPLAFLLASRTRMYRTRMMIILIMMIIA